MKHKPEQLALDLYRFFRLSAIGATAVLPIIGAASVERGLSARRTAGLLGVAAAFHAFAYVHNDVCDLDVDRTQPLRAQYPLVRGAVSPRAALALALACTPLAFALDQRIAARDDAAVQPGLDRRVALAAAFALMGAYNRWGKACPLPPLTDLIQAMGWAALLLYGALAQGGPTRLTAALAAYELLLIMMVNGVHGALRDLANDRARGVRTTAIWLGADARPDGGLSVPPALAGYALALQAALLALPIWTAATSLVGDDGGARATAVAATSLDAALIVALLAAAARGGARPADIGMLHLILLLSAPLAVLGPGMRPATRATLLAAHTLPLLANGMTYDALRWAARIIHR